MATPDTPSIDLEHAFSIRFELGGHINFSGAMRSRTFEPVVGGEIFGPKLQGRVVPQSGADYSSNGLMDTRLMLQSAEGIWIYMDQCGYELEQEDGSPYYRVSPYFDTPQGSLEWLAKTVFLGTGERQTSPSQVLIHYYEVL